MNKASSIKVEIGLQGNKVSIDLPNKEFELIREDLKSNKPKWIQIKLDKGATLDIFTDHIQYIKSRPPEVRELKMREGVTLKSICAVLNVNYDVFRQKIKKDGVALDMSAGRRILLTPSTIKSLGLTDTHISKLNKMKE